MKSKEIATHLSIKWQKRIPGGDSNRSIRSDNHRDRHRVHHFDENLSSQSSGTLAWVRVTTLRAHEDCHRLLHRQSDRKRRSCGHEGSCAIHFYFYIPIKGNWNAPSRGWGAITSLTVYDFKFDRSRWWSTKWLYIQHNAKGLENITNSIENMKQRNQSCTHESSQEEA